MQCAPWRKSMISFEWCFACAQICLGVRRRSSLIGCFAPSFNVLESLESVVYAMILAPSVSVLPSQSVHFLCLCLLTEPPTRTWANFGKLAIGQNISGWQCSLLHCWLHQHMSALWPVFCATCETTKWQKPRTLWHDPLPHAFLSCSKPKSENICIRIAHRSCQLSVKQPWRAVATTKADDA